MYDSLGLFGAPFLYKYIMRYFLFLSLLVNLAIITAAIFGIIRIPLVDQHLAKTAPIETITTTVTVHYVNDLSQIPANKGKSANDRLYGMAKWNAWDATTPRTCEIYVQKPKNRLDLTRMATMGHELLHCTDGHFHPPNIEAE